LIYQEAIMPTTPFQTFTGVKLEPYYYPEKAKTRAVNLAAGTYEKGTVLGQFTGTATNEVQTLTATGTVSGGTYKLSFDGYETAALAYNASVAVVQAAIDALANVDPGDITVGGGAFPGTPLTFTFAGQFAARNVPLIAVSSSVTGGGSIAMAQTTAGVSSSGTYGTYATGNTDGTGVAVCLLVYPCVVDENGTVAMMTNPTGFQESLQKTAPVYDGGYFHTSDLIGLDADAIADLQARMVEGTLTGGGVVYIP
jgi:hypothetical protein